ncbi:MAG: hypothetical protein CSA21_04820 [Deltaproteobacteria bacterium]|nr:MAG: hypothetical protein CSA21_04820 [Deltaproteobacteria bacterium]
MDLVEQIRQEGWNAGRLNGRQEGTRKTATNLKAMGMSSDIIQQATGLSLEEIDLLDTTSGITEEDSWEKIQ